MQGRKDGGLFWQKQFLLRENILQGVSLFQSRREGKKKKTWYRGRTLVSELIYLKRFYLVLKGERGGSTLFTGGEWEQEGEIL